MTLLTPETLLNNNNSFSNEPIEHECTTLDVIDLLLGRTTMNDVAQYMVLRGLAAHRPTQLSIYEIGTDGLMSLIGSFGSGEGRGDLHGLSIVEKHTVGEQLRNGHLWANYPNESQSWLPLVHGQSVFDAPQCLWPLLTPTKLCGALHMRFSDEPTRDSFMSDLAALTPPITLLLDQTNRTRPEKRRATDGLTNQTSIQRAHPAERVGTPNPLAIENLTDRQRAILSRMCQGMTNTRIARDMRFSESTVRQETMAIYRTLNVKGRPEAIACASPRFQAG